MLLYSYWYVILSFADSSASSGFYTKHVTTPNDNGTRQKYAEYGNTICTPLII